VAIGKQAKATSTSCLALGESANSSTAYGIAIGYQAVASGVGSIAIGNQYYLGAATASGGSSIAIGDDAEATKKFATALGAASVSNIAGKYAYAGGRFSSTGDSQTGVFVLRSDTTDATPEALTTDNSTAGTTNQIILPNNSAYAFHGTIVARQQASAGTACAAWKIEGLIRREGSAGTTVLVNSATTVWTTHQHGAWLSAQTRPTVA
jgi:trimeric autotransporter adhesin